MIVNEFLPCIPSRVSCTDMLSECDGPAIYPEHAVRRFSRYHNPLGHWLRQTTQRLYRLLARANDARDAAGVLALDERRLIRPPSGAPSFLSAVRTVR